MPAPQPLSVKPLLCAQCGGPVPLSDADAAPCPYCRASVAIPPEHRQLRAAMRRSEHDHAALAAAFAQLGAPPGILLHAWAGTAQGAISFLWKATTVFLKVWLWLLVSFVDVLKAVDDIRVMGVILILPLLPVFGVLLAIGAGAHTLAPALGVDLVDVLTAPGAYALAGLLLYVLIAVPVAAYHFGETFADIRHRLQASMAAQPPTREGGPSLCRRCGGALEVPAGALGVRCDYCRTDNLVALSPDWVAAASAKERSAHSEVVRAVIEEQQVRAAARSHLVRVLLLSALMLPTLAAGGLVMCRMGAISGRADLSALAVGAPALVPHPAAWLDAPVSLRDLGPGGQTVALVRGDCRINPCHADYDVPLHRGDTLAITTRPGASTQVLLAADNAFSDLHWQSVDPGRAQLRQTADYTGWYHLRVTGGSTESAWFAWHIEPAR